MSVTWLTAFLDRPAPLVDEAVRFWTLVTDTTTSPVRGDRGQFATLLPGSGDACLKVQTVLEGGGGHLDLHVTDLDATAARAADLGASVSPREGYVTCVSPAGLRWCLVRTPEPVDGARLRHAAPVTRSGGHRTRVTQLCVDVPPGRFDAECAFWGDLTGWEVRPTSHPEFADLVGPAGMPFEILLQRLEADPPDGHAGCHLDVRCDDAAREVALHETWGATVRQRLTGWTVLTDPSGFPYCVVDGDPA